MALFTVTNLNNSGAGSLRQAIIDANLTAAEDTIQFALGITGGTTAGVNDGVITLTTGELTITNDIIINGDVDGDGRADINISGNDASRVIYAFSAGTDVALRGLDISNGLTTYGDPTLGGYGGAILGLGGSLSLTNSTVRDSVTAGAIAVGGGIVGENVTLANTSIVGNSSTFAGGILTGGGTNIFTNVTISDNVAETGGGIFDNSGVLSIRSSTITDNSGPTAGGGIYLGNGGSLTLENSILSDNSSPSGENLYVDPGSTLTFLAYNSVLGSDLTPDPGSFANVITDLPGLSALADFGGPVVTHVPLAGSAAISAGNAGFLPTDFSDIDNDGNTSEVVSIDARGGPRVQDLLDIGAAEFITSVVVDTLDDIDNGDLSDGDVSLREAIDLVGAGGTITFAAGITGGTTAGVDDGVITLGGTQLVIARDMEINGDVDGDGHADITISGDDASRVFSLTGSPTNVTLRSLDITNGYSSSSGGAIDSLYGDKLTVINSTIRDSESGSFGGGIRSDNLYVVNSTFSNNTATHGGALSIFNGKTAILDNVTMSGNSVTGQGGAIFAGNNTSLTITSSTITDNTSGSTGGGVTVNTGTSLTVENSIVSGNTGASSDDIGKFGTATLTAENSLLGTTVVIDTDNGNNISSDTPGLDALADNGGIVQTHALQFTSAAVGAGDATLLRLDDFDVDNDGQLLEILPIDANGNRREMGDLDIGAVELAFAATVVDTLSDVVDGNYSAGNLSLREAINITSSGGSITFDASITGGTTAGVDDGVITLNGNRLILQQDVVIDGDTNGDNKADITIDANGGSRVISVNNSADIDLLSLTLANGDADRGGALRMYSGSNVNLVNSTIDGSYASHTGGGIYNQGGNLTVVNSTVSNNGAYYHGGGIFHQSGTTTLVNTTVAGNNADFSGDGAYAVSGTVNILNSTFSDELYLRSFPNVLAQNSIFADGVVGTIDTASNNIITANTAAAGLAALADNGGLVQTHALISGSLAIGAGDDALLPADLVDIDEDGNFSEDLPLDAHGVGRTNGSGVLDAGAVQFDDFGKTPATAGSVAVDGTVTGDIEQVNDEDWFGVTFTAGEVYEINVSGTGAGLGTNPDVQLVSIYDAAGNPISGTFNDDGGPDLDSRLIFEATQTGLHHIAAGAFQNNIGTYTVSVTLISDDIGETAATADAVTVGGSSMGEIEFTGDEDWFAVNLVSGTTYTIDLEGSPTSGGTLTDTFLHGIYDASETFIPGTTDDDGGVGSNSQLSFTAAATGVHYISAGAFNAALGTYTLSVTEVTGVTLRDLGNAVVGTFSTIADALAAAADDYSITVGAGYSANPETVSTSLDNLTFDLSAGVTPTINLTGSAAQTVNLPGSGSATVNGTAFGGVLNGGAGDDTYTGAGGFSILNGNGGDDALNVHLASTDFAFDLQVSDSLLFTENAGGGGSAYQTAQVETINFTDLSFNGIFTPNGSGTYLGTGVGDIISGDGNANYLLDLSGGDDILVGGGGNDQLQGSGGADRYYGGADTDEVRYNNSDAAVTVNLATGAASGGHAAGDTFDSIENLVGSGYGDTLIGDDGVNRLDGFNGDDILRGGLGADILFGGLGEDTADYSDSSFGVDVGHFRIGTGGTSEGDQLIQVERIIGSDHVDTLVGSGVYNLAVLSGGAGADLLFDYGGASQLNGGAGNDTMIGRLGADAFDGGADIDVVRYADAVGAVNANLTTGMGTGADAQGDTYVDVENLVGSIFFDTLVGDGGVNTLRGGAGRDTITGAGGNDLLYGEADLDTFVFDTLNWGDDIIFDFDANPGREKMDFTGTGLSFADFVINDTAFGLRIDYADATAADGFSSIALAGIDPSAITSDDFIFGP